LSASAGAGGAAATTSTASRSRSRYITPPRPTRGVRSPIGF